MEKRFFRIVLKKKLNTVSRFVTPHYAMTNLAMLPDTVFVRVKDVLACGVTRWRLRRLRADGRLVRYRPGFLREDVLRVLRA